MHSTPTPPSSTVLGDAYGQCGIKGTLLMALLRALGIACRFHGFTTDKALLRNALTGMADGLKPANIIHSWVEASIGERWVKLEDFILDDSAAVAYTPAPCAAPCWSS